MMSHEEASELLAAFALDAVEGDEYLRVEGHVATCPRCRAELDGHREVAAALGNAVEPLPEGLWSRISSRLPEQPGAEPPPMPQLEPRTADGPAHPQRDRPRRRAHRVLSASGRFPVLTIGSLAMAAAVVAVVLGVNLVHADNQVATYQNAIGNSAPAAVQAALHTPGHRVVNLTDADHRRVAQFVTVPDGRGYLVSSALPALPPNKTYQLWGGIGGKQISLGLLGQSPSHVTFTSATARPLRSLAVTVEPAGGSLTPTPPMTATGRV